MKTTTYFTGHGSGSVPRQGATRKSGSGGGARVVERSAHKVEPRAYAMSPEGVSQYGAAQGNHVSGIEGGGRTTQGGVKSMYAGPGYNNVGPTPCGEGPGAGRSVQASGGQGQHGPVAGTPFEPSDRGWAPPPGGIHRR
jgi:hypothetical protein